MRYNLIIGATLSACLLLAGCSTSPYESDEWSEDGELRQKHLDELVARAAQHEASGQDPMADAVLLRSDSIAPLAAESVTAELQAIAEELSQSWAGEPCRCQVRLGPSYSFGGFTYPNGTIIIQAGTLEYLDSRDELAALLSHELAHLWLDHYEKNRLQSATKGLTDLAQAISIFSDDEDARKTTMRLGGSTDALVAAAGFTQWNRRQETEADLLAAKILEKSRYSPMAMIAMLTKLRKGKDEVPVAGSAYEEMAEVTAKKLKKEETDISDNQIQSWLKAVSDDMGGREYLSSEERRQIVRSVIYGLEGATLARSFTSLGVDLDTLKPVTSLKALYGLEPSNPAYLGLVDQALKQEPANLHLQLIKFRALASLGDQKRAEQMAVAFIESPDATFSVLSAATQFLDQHGTMDAETRKSLMRKAVTKLVELDLPEAYVADQYYLSNRYQVPLYDKLNETLCVAGTGKTNVRERCEIAREALEGNRSFYRLLATAEQ
ncbi:M48 family metalloprotease [Marinobacter sp. TBZ242]|uniref:M48 family metalloprotease n=1 Tax=Marinobacter azerbaijanicus TaxID=3050455 RepID=A0ABT7IFF2_9GAMM|nr:M48 family metalloprotease [Marinobacter sp. TBZ242]MDL0432889.1 M48 family metalloprotease [Marinobacter sp. TBZ242]